jgi:hypothetical protein
MTDSGTLERSLAALRAELSPSAADKLRLRARIVAPTLAGGAASTAAPLTRWAALQAAGSLGVASGLVLLALGGSVGFWLGRDGAHELAANGAVAAPRTLASSPRAGIAPSSPSVIAKAESAEAAIIELAPVEPATVEPAPVEPMASSSTPANEGHHRGTPVRPRATRKALAPNPLNDELALLRRVERALRNADPALAVALLAELDERFPDSRLVEERLAARRIADCRLGSGDALAQARAFLREHPASVYRQRVQLACDVLDAQPPAAFRQPTAAPMKNAERADTHGR